MINLHLNEFQQSAIPDRLTLANVHWIDGDAAIELLASEAIAKVQRVTSYATNPARQILDRYQFMAAGCWYAVGTTLDGSPASIPAVAASTRAIFSSAMMGIGFAAAFFFLLRR